MVVSARRGDQPVDIAQRIPGLVGRQVVWLWHSQRLRPMRGLKQDRNARVIIMGHAFVRNIRRGHYELAVEEPQVVGWPSRSQNWRSCCRAGYGSAALRYALRSHNATDPVDARGVIRVSGSLNARLCGRRIPSWLFLYRIRAGEELGQHESEIFGGYVMPLAFQRAVQGVGKSVGDHL
jgi:hypothetical protein